MQRLLRATLIVAAALAVPIVPVLFFGASLEQRFAAVVEAAQSRRGIVLAVAAVLAVDVLLPVPSSAVSTFGGAQLGVVLGTAASWIGMTAGAVAGFALARWCGAPLARRRSRPDDLEQLESLTRRFGPVVLALTRALPVLAEASVLVVGATRLSWPRFLVPVALANLGIAAVYSALGSYAGHWYALPAALAASVALPLAATFLARGLLRRRMRPAPSLSNCGPDKVL